MKTLSTLFLLLFFSLFFTSCNNNDEEIINQTVAENSSTIKFITQKFTGTISRIDISSWQYGTHVLSISSIDKRARYVVLSSKTIDLNKYNGQKVEVTAKLIHKSISGGPEHYNVIDIKVINDTKIYQFTGKIFKSRDVTNWMYGSHIMKLINGNYIALSSKTIDLNKYMMGRTVRITATKIHGSLSGGPDYFEVLTIIPIQK